MIKNKSMVSATVNYMSNLRIPLRWVKDKDCIVALNHLDEKNYPRLHIQNKFYRISRVLLFRRYGHQPSNIVSRHTCDNSKCINPDHIIPGTRADNARDMMSRG